LIIKSGRRKGGEGTKGGSSVGKERRESRCSLFSLFVSLSSIFENNEVAIFFILVNIKK
jgi:hypothetical protein